MEMKQHSHVPGENGTVDVNGVRGNASSSVGARYFPDLPLVELVVFCVDPACCESPPRCVGTGRVAAFCRCSM
jgi:hypothetical protein